MHLAAQYNNTLFLDLLLQYGGDIDAVNDDR
jgi:ankyrin repeat protein